ncbi:PEP-CTERM sorting domain-containing protein [Methyloversatilis sp.]|uniref:PEP-CTERM sorting domain-containing protein n=1 Tax=Methyloversatilis sp. TaxID=2569862 RepID=UPI003F6F8417
MKLAHVAVATVLAGASLGAAAGDFVELNKSFPLRLSASNNQLTDIYYLETNITMMTITESFRDVRNRDIPLVASRIDYNARSTSGSLSIIGSGTLSLLEYRLNEDVQLAGQAIGDIYDFVYRDSRDNKLVFGTRVILGLPGQQQNAELNNVFRYGFEEDGTTFDAAAAWLFLSNFDLRLYSAARSDQGLKQMDVFDPDAVSFQSDINLSEGNPYSGLYLLKTDATSYTYADNAIGYFQAGEESQPVVKAFTGGFIPTNTAPIPEPSTYAMLLAGLGMIGVIARRRMRA